MHHVRPFRVLEERTTTQATVAPSIVRSAAVSEVEGSAPDSGRGSPALSPVLVGLVATLLGCATAPNVDAGDVDAGRRDAGRRDAAQPASDASTPDDASVEDAAREPRDAFVPRAPEGEVERVLPEELRHRVGEIQWDGLTGVLEVNRTVGRGNLEFAMERGYEDEEELQQTLALGPADELSVRFELALDAVGPINWCRSLETIARTFCLWGYKKREAQLVFARGPGRSETIELDSLGTRYLGLDGIQRFYARSHHVVAAGDDLYLTEVDKSPGRILRVRGDGVEEVVTGSVDLENPTGIAFAPEVSRLYVAARSYTSRRSRIVFFELEGGELGAAQPLVEGLDGAHGLVLDEAGGLYVADRNSVRIFDRDGNEQTPIEVLTSPGRNERVLDLAFGDPDRRTLYVGTGTDLGGGFTPGGDYVGGLYRVRLPVAGLPR